MDKDPEGRGPRHSGPKDKGPKDHFTPRHYASKDTRGPLPFLNPTRRHLPLPPSDAKASPAVEEQQVAAEEEPTAQPAYHIWRSRDNRKGRHAIAVTEENAARSAIRPSDSLVESLKGLGKMLVRYPIWDVSYDVAMIYTLGSVVWCINGFFLWYPLYRPSTYFPGEEDTAGGISALVGATIFEVGATLAMLEAVNENRTDCFGWALEQAVEDGFPVVRREARCRHHHPNKRSFFGPRRNRDGGGGAGPEKKQKNGNVEREDSGGEEKVDQPQTKGKRRWSWWPSWYELRTHYFRDIGFLGCLIQFLGATIFWIAGIVGMPSILGGMSTPLEDGIYWAPQVVGGSGFIISSFLFMLETQEKWYLPAPKLLGWHIGFWNWVGGIGFTLCGALGFGASNSAVNYAASLSTFVGSWAFLFGSLIQLYESLNKYPIVVVKGD